MKKILSLVLVAIMLLGIVPTAFAASTPSITVKADKSVIGAGNVVTFTVSVSANSNITALTHIITYNTSEFEYVADSAVAAENGGYAAVNGNTSGKITYATALTKKMTSGQTLYTFKLKAKKQVGTVSATVVEAYIEENEKDKDVTSAVAAASTKTISFNSTSDYIAIREPSVKTIRYKDAIVLHADVKKTLPSNARIEWSTDNSNFKTKTSSDGKSFTITSNSNGSTVITATLYSSSGTVLEVETVEMTSKAGFFDIIGGFFRSLFGATKTYDQ